FALLLCGTLHDWLRNPQYVLEEATQLGVASLEWVQFEDRACDSVSTSYAFVWNFFSRLASYRDRWAEERRWPARVKFVESVVEEASLPQVLGQSCAQGPSLSPRVVGGRVLDKNLDWTYVVLLEREPGVVEGRDEGQDGKHLELVPIP
ncbi:unnamed protein product, partial [Polarella glacialis]